MLADRHVGEAQRHQQADAHRRQEQADADGGGLHDVEVDRVDADLRRRSGTPPGSAPPRRAGPPAPCRTACVMQRDADQEQPVLRLRAAPARRPSSSGTPDTPIRYWNTVATASRKITDAGEDAAVVGDAAASASRRRCGSRASRRASAVDRDHGAGLGRGEGAEDRSRRGSRPGSPSAPRRRCDACSRRCQLGRGVTSASRSMRALDVAPGPQAEP